MSLISSNNLTSRFAPPVLGQGNLPLGSPPALAQQALPAGTVSDSFTGASMSPGLTGASGGTNIMTILPQLLSMVSMLLQQLIPMLGGQNGGSANSLQAPANAPASGGGQCNQPSAPPAPESGGGQCNQPSTPPAPESGGDQPAPQPTPESSQGDCAPCPKAGASQPEGNKPEPNPAPKNGECNGDKPAGSNPESGNEPYGGETPDSNPDPSLVGKKNVAGQGKVDPNKPIYVPMVNGKYDQKALDALAKQGLNGIDPEQAKDNTNKGGDPGQATNDSWTLANGPLAGVKNGAAIAWGCYKNGYTSKDDLINAAAVASVESNNSKENGQCNGSGYTQKNEHIFAPNTGNAKGLFQLDPHWNSTKDAFNPFVNSIRAINLMTVNGNRSSIAHDAPTYNTGRKDATYATAQGDYVKIPDIVRSNLDTLRA